MSSRTSEGLKRATRDFFQRASCGEIYARGTTQVARFEAQRTARYHYEPYIFEFARFHEGRDRDILEVGVGMGADHLEWANAKPRTLTGVDLTPRAIHFTRERLALYGFSSNLMVTDAESLPFDTSSFDLVYSWGVLHATPDTPQAIREVHRVLRPGGIARVMVYHTYSMVGYMLWLRYGFLAFRPFRSLADIYAQHLENPGTKAYRVEDVGSLFRDFSRILSVRTMLTSSDLLKGECGQQHRGWVLALAKRLWPRWFIRRFLRGHGLWLMIEAIK
jgi:ubiquinone/menaquinone biosynthesis C-methylase UbiE